MNYFFQMKQWVSGLQPSLCIRVTWDLKKKHNSCPGPSARNLVSICLEWDSDSDSFQKLLEVLNLQPELKAIVKENKS